MAVLDRTADRVPDDQFPVACDVSRSDEVASAVASVVEHFGSLDIVINDAGPRPIGMAVAMPARV